MRKLFRSLSLAALTVALLFTRSAGPLTAQGTPSYVVGDLGALVIPMPIAAIFRRANSGSTRD